MSETGEVDTILLLEFGPADAPLEVVLSETRPGSPENIRKQLEAMKIRSGLFVYVSGYKQIFTAEEYLRLWNRVDHVYFSDDPGKCSVPVTTGSMRDLADYFKERDRATWDNYYIVRTDTNQMFTPAQYIGLSFTEHA